jgi:hypothetical protein
MIVEKPMPIRMYPKTYRTLNGLLMNLEPQENHVLFLNRELLDIKMGRKPIKMIPVLSPTSLLGFK